MGFLSVVIWARNGPLMMLRAIKYTVREFVRCSFIRINNLMNSVKLVFPKHLNKITVFFLRKTRTFIKSKYSRTRQWSKTIVYFGLWYGVASVWFMMIHTYKFIFVLSYIWSISALFCIIILLRFFKKNLSFMRLTNCVHYAIEIELVCLTWLKTR
jgi:hypothetical protein